MVVVILGSNGFTGKFLTKKLIETHRKEDLLLSDIQLESENDSSIPYVSLNLAHFNEVLTFIGQYKPSKIYFLVGVYNITNIDLMFEVNLKTVLNLLESIHRLQIQPKMLFISSSAVYGWVDRISLPLKEETELSPSNFYGMSKLLMETSIHQYHKFCEFDFIIVRPSNLIGPNGSKSLLPIKLVDQVKEIMKNERTSIEVHNIIGERDYIDVRDAVTYYNLLMESRENNLVVNVGTGVLSSVKKLIDVLQILLKTTFEVKPLAKNIASNQIAHSIDPKRIIEITNYQPMFGISESFEFMLGL